MNYEQSGVSQAKADVFVNSILKMTGAHQKQSRVIQGIGGYASVFEITKNKWVAATTDGVGTKIKLALELDDHTTIGEDLVAMCVNDLVCVGATPLFFLDYFAVQKLEDQKASQVLSGIVKACEMSDMLLLGGETAQLPDLYNHGEYDLAGFAVGELAPAEHLDCQNFTEGDAIIGIASNGFHSNGYSLLRKYVFDYEIDLKKDLLKPTVNYVPIAKELLKTQNVKGLAHITGGGFSNITRLNASFDYIFSNIPQMSELPSVFTKILTRMNLNRSQQYETFNMGIGMMCITNNPHDVLMFLEKNKIQAWKLGYLKRGSGKYFI